MGVGLLWAILLGFESVFLVIVLGVCAIIGARRRSLSRTIADIFGQKPK